MYMYVCIMLRCVCKHDDYVDIYYVNMYYAHIYMYAIS